jgi:hypothetical protein
VERASRIFGVVSSPLLNASNLAKLADEIQVRARQNIETCRQLVTALTGHLADFGHAREKAPRYQTAEAVLNLIEAVRDVKPAAVIEALASLTPQTSEAAMGASLTSSADVVNALAATQWRLFESIRSLQDDRSAAAGLLLERVSGALRNDQHVTALAPVLRIEQNKAIDLLTPPRPLVKPPIAPLVEPPVERGKKVVDSGTRENLSLAEAENEIARLRKNSKGNQVARINVSWIIEE